MAIAIHLSCGEFGASVLPCDEMYYEFRMIDIPATAQIAPFARDGAVHQQLR
jgi:hypothetical protein